MRQSLRVDSRGSKARSGAGGDLGGCAKFVFGLLGVPALVGMARHHVVWFSSRSASGLLGAWLWLAAAATAQVVPTLASRFDAGGTEGWTATSALACQGTNAVGNPAGSLFVDNADTGGTGCRIHAPAAFRGDLRSYYGGTLSFDGMLAPGATGTQSNAQYDYGRVQLFDVQGYSIVADAAPGVPSSTQWTTYTLALTPATFGVSQATLDYYLGNVVGLAIGLEALGGLEAHYIDNVVLAPSTLPAAAQPAGAGCATVYGSNTLVATTLPWLGAPFRTTAYGMPGFCLAFGVYGLTPLPATPLPTLLPPALAGRASPVCEAHASPDVVLMVTTTSLTAGFTWQLPALPAMAGVTLWHQVVPVALDGGSNVLSISSTNALRLTLGLR